MDWTGWRQFARIEIKYIDSNDSRFQIDVLFQKFSHGACISLAAARECNVRMPGTQLRLEPSGERGFLNTLVHLEQMRMAPADANPNNFRQILRRKTSNIRDRQKKSAELNCAQSFAKLQIDIFRHAPKETERQVHLLRFCPSDTADFRI